MDPISALAAGTVAALAPYFAKAGEEFAKQAGKAAAIKIDKLYRALKIRFKKNPAAKEALADLESDPHNEDVKAALRHQLTKQMKDDPILVDTLEQLMGEVKADKGSMSFLTQVYGGEVGKLFNIGNVDTLYT